MLGSLPAMADKIVSSDIGQCLLIVVQERRPRGHKIASTRLGYNAQKLAATTSGGNAENLFLIAIPDGIALKAKTPVTVYPTGVLTTGSVWWYLLRQARKQPAS